MSANFDLVGSWKETKTEIDVVDLPAVVARSIAIKYPGAVILSADKIDKSDGKIIYVANLEVKSKKIEAQVFADGRFVK
jgi:hypothetical protein